MKRGTECVQCGQFRVYQKLASGLCPECRGLNNKLRLVVFGAESDTKIMDVYQYETFLRTASSTDFDTHLAIDIDIDMDTLNQLQVITNSNELRLILGGAK